MIAEEEPNSNVRNAFDQWCHEDFSCRNFVLNALADSLYNVYANVTIAKEL